MDKKIEKLRKSLQNISIELDEHNILQYLENKCNEHNGDMAQIIDDNLIIHLGLCGLKFMVNNNLILIEEQWHDGNDTQIKYYDDDVGDATIENIDRIVDMFIKYGKYKNVHAPDLIKLIKIEK